MGRKGLVDGVVERVWGQERTLTLKAYGLSLVFVTSGAVGSYYAYSFVKRFNLSTLLRNVPRKSLKDVEPGDYVRVEGVVAPTPPQKGGVGVASVATESGADYLVSPKEGVHCVVYQLTEYRVIEEVTTTTTSVGKSRAKGRASDKVDTTDGRIVRTKDKWSKKEEVMKDVRRSVPAYLLESQDSPSSPYLHLDLSGDPLFFELHVVHDEFKKDERQVETRSSRRTLGYREVEKVLPLFTPLLVFGEVSRKSGTGEGAGAEELVIKRPATQHMFDRKTARRKPFVVTTLNETELTNKVEALARFDLYVAGGCSVLALVTGGLAYLAFGDLKSLREVKAVTNMLN